jgi:hypothetical protein
MKKIILGVLLSFMGAMNANQASHLQDCLNQCENAKQICGAQATLTLARVNACNAVDDDFGDNYNCSVICQQNPRTTRFEAVE